MTANHAVPVSSAQSLAWRNGEFIAADALCVPVGDAGFVLGATVTEQLRTFRGQLFLCQQHSDRLQHSLAVVGIQPAQELDEIVIAAAELATHNYGLHASLPQFAGDLGLVIFITPGNQPSQHEGRTSPPLVAIHTFPLAFALWAEAYRVGMSLRSVVAQQVPEACWPVQAKVRSRLHYFLADREADAAERGSRAVLCHGDGRVSETSTANIAIVKDGVISTPPSSDALRGVSLFYLRQLAESLGMLWQERSLQKKDLAKADEILLTSTPNCLLAATRYDGELVGTGHPGPVQKQLLAAWSQNVGVDIAAQAVAIASESLS